MFSKYSVVRVDLLEDISTRNGNFSWQNKNV